jgi:hypothetical protein
MMLIESELMSHQRYVQFDNDNTVDKSSEALHLENAKR